MQLLRYSHDAWGREVLEGVSFDLAWWFAGATLAFILLHVLYRWLRRPQA
ncbi:MAG: hypothetical protein U1F30_15875 [Steroidobacteraceae bacterium]